RDARVPPQDLVMAVPRGRREHPVACGCEVIRDRMRMFGEKLDQLEIQPGDGASMEATEQEAGHALSVGAACRGHDVDEHRLADHDRSSTTASRLQRPKYVV